MLESVPARLVRHRLSQQELIIRAPQETGYASLRRLLETYASQECSVPHDKVYGLLGLAADYADITVDYLKDLTELYLEVIHHVQPYQDTIGFSRLLVEGLGIFGQYDHLANIARMRYDQGYSFFIMGAGSVLGEVLDASFPFTLGSLLPEMEEKWTAILQDMYPTFEALSSSKAKAMIQKLHDI